MTTITIQNLVKAPLERVWEYYTSEDHIINWNFASPDWCCPKAKNDLQAGGKFNYRMEAKDGSAGFDFNGSYLEVKDQELIHYTIEDGREVVVSFTQVADGVEVVVAFEAETQNDVSLQRQGWLAILTNFKNYVEHS